MIKIMSQITIKIGVIIPSGALAGGLAFLL